jgi:hypothetical protein
MKLWKIPNLHMSMLNWWKNPMILTQNPFITILLIIFQLSQYALVDFTRISIRLLTNNS